MHEVPEALTEALNKAHAQLRENLVFQMTSRCRRREKINLLSFRCSRCPHQKQEHLCNDEKHYNFNLVIGLSTIYASDRRKRKDL